MDIKGVPPIFRASYTGAKAEKRGGYGGRVAEGGSDGEPPHGALLPPEYFLFTFPFRMLLFNIEAGRDILYLTGNKLINTSVKPLK